ncbi:hypothetical protein [Candidatus Chlorohelix sp.]|uniref:hypothetical protein n=1 Tax=Candidatus Chlorohelix sp. TaxID=3139201 RepID=UPI0030271EAA
MTPEDSQNFNEAVSMAQSGMKETAYVVLNQLHKKYPADTHLMLWIAFTSPDILASKSFIRRAERLNPDNPDLPAARQWLQAEESKRVSGAAINMTQPVADLAASFSQATASLKKNPPINPLIITLISVVILILIILVVALLVRF